MKTLRKVRTEPDLVEFAAAYAVTERQVAGRAGLSTQALRCLLNVALLGNLGLHTHTADVIATEGAPPAATRRYLKHLLQHSYLERVGGPVRGHVVLTLEGRRLLAAFVRGWQRGRNQLRGLQPCAPFRRTTPKNPAAPSAPNYAS